MTKPRIDIANAYFHIFNRGKNHRTIFQDREDYFQFFHLLKRAHREEGLLILAYSLMGNHYHLIARSGPDGLAQSVTLLFKEYAKYFNLKYAEDGPLFTSRFKSKPISDDAYLLSVLRYVHLNPCEAKMVPRPELHEWTSHRIYLGHSPKPEWFDTSFVLNYFHDEAKNFDRFVMDGRLEATKQPGY